MLIFIANNILVATSPRCAVEFFVNGKLLIANVGQESTIKKPPCKSRTAILTNPSNFCEDERPGMADQRPLNPELRPGTTDNVSLITKLRRWDTNHLDLVL